MIICRKTVSRPAPKFGTDRNVAPEISRSFKPLLYTVTKCSNPFVQAKSSWYRVTTNSAWAFVTSRNWLRFSKIVARSVVGRIDIADIPDIPDIPFYTNTRIFYGIMAAFSFFKIRSFAFTISLADRVGIHEGARLCQKGWNKTTPSFFTIPAT